jgi:hypothetical protein
MESIWTEHSGQRYHVLGIELTDPALIDRTKKVVHTCFALLAILLIRAIILLAIGEPAGSTLLSFLFNLSIPAFGYLGARDGSSLLMCIFVALMTLNAANAIAVLVIVAHAALTHAPQKLPSGLVQPFTMTTSVWIQVGLIAAWAVMALIGAYHSYKLFTHLAKGDFARRTDDSEAGLPPIEKPGQMEPDSFGLPGSSTLHERDVDEELNSPVRRKRSGGTEMRPIQQKSSGRE